MDSQAHSGWLIAFRSVTIYRRFESDTKSDIRRSAVECRIKEILEEMD